MSEAQRELNKYFASVMGKRGLILKLFGIMVLIVVVFFLLRRK